MVAIRIFNSLAALPILLVLLSLALMPQAAHAAARKADLVIIYKQQRLMKLMSRGDMLRQYPIALGFDPQEPKRQRGDGRTPEGPYRIDWRNAHSSFHLSPHINYPRPAAAPPAAAVSADPGDDIMIHGLPNGFTADRIGHPGSTGPTDASR